MEYEWIRGKDAKPEIAGRMMMHAAGFRFRLHVKDLPGKPDIVLPKWKTVIFVHGCSQFNRGESAINKPIVLDMFGAITP